MSEFVCAADVCASSEDAVICASVEEAVVFGSVGGVVVCAVVEVESGSAELVVVKDVAVVVSDVDCEVTWAVSSVDVELVEEVSFPGSSAAELLFTSLDITLGTALIVEEALEETDVMLYGN